MPRQIKMIWDFKGISALQTAQHHEIHLKDYIQTEKLPILITGFETISEFHYIAFLVTTDEFLLQIRDNLKPHRAELFQN